MVKTGKNQLIPLYINKIYLSFFLDENIVTHVFFKQLIKSLMFYQLCPLRI